MSETKKQGGLRQIKVWVNWLLDRIIDICDLSLMDVYKMPFYCGQSIIHKMARVTGDFCWLLRDFPRMSAYRISQADLAVIFVGGRQGLTEIRALLFPDSQAASEELGRYKLWRLGRQTQCWMETGASLVVCETSRFFKTMIAQIDISVPKWIGQFVEMPESLETMLAGTARRDIRKRIHKARKAGFQCNGLTRSKKDFDYFYEQMYLPFVNVRHGERALVTPYEDQLKRWFQRGGLVPVTRGSLPIAGGITYAANGICHLIEAGVSTDDSQLLGQEINAFLYLSVMKWAHSVGIRSCDMGGSYAYRHNGSFSFKREWGARVVRRRRIYPVWHFLARDIPATLRNRLNELGFITEIEGKFWGVWIDVENEQLDEQGIRIKLMEMKKAGLSGLAVISFGKQELFPCPDVNRKDSVYGEAAAAKGD